MSREKIKEAALELFRHYSYVKTSVADIATAAGIGKGTVYLSFKTKEEILLALLDDEIAAYRVRTDAYFENPSVPLLEKVEAFAQNLLDQHFNIRDLMFGSFENVEGRELQDVYQKFATYIEQCVDCLAAFTVLHGYPETVERRAALLEFVLFLSGRIVIYILSHDWNSREEISRLMPVWARQIFQALVLQERS